MAHSELNFSKVGASRNRRSGRMAAVETQILSGQIDILRSRVWVLSGADKGLMEMYLDGVSFRQMASVGGINEATVARKVAKIIKRLMSGTYITCLRNRQQLGETTVAIARDHLICGMSGREIANKHDMSLYRVRKILMRIRSIQ